MFSIHLTALRYRRWLGGLVALGMLSGLLLVSAGAGAARRRGRSPAISRDVGAGPSCTSPVGICTHGTLTGGVKGTFDFVASAVTPAAPSGVVFLSGNTIIRTTTGLNLFTADSATVNTNPGSDGEFAGLDEITTATPAPRATSSSSALLGRCPKRHVHREAGQP